MGRIGGRWVVGGWMLDLECWKLDLKGEDGMGCERVTFMRAAKTHFFAHACMDWMDGWGVTFFYMNAEIAFQQRTGRRSWTEERVLGWVCVGFRIHTYSTIQARMIDMNEVLARGIG